MLRPAVRFWSLLLVTLVLLAGCLGTPTTGTDATSANPTATATERDSTFFPTPTASPTLTPFPDIPDGGAGRRAIAAEKARIENATADWGNLTDLSFGILRPASYEIVERNETGIVVDVEVGYSMEFACGNATESTHSVDGAGSEARYLVTEDPVELLSGDDIYDSDAHACD
jgi:hypothetical protein